VALRRWPSLTLREDLPAPSRPALRPGSNTAVAGAGPRQSRDLSGSYHRPRWPRSQVAGSSRVARESDWRPIRTFRYFAEALGTGTRGDHYIEPSSRGRIPMWGLWGLSGVGCAMNCSSSRCSAPCSSPCADQGLTDRVHHHSGPQRAHLPHPNRVCLRPGYPSCTLIADGPTTGPANLLDA
jgi:hypothetical protein